jgi:hypothetical protein
METLRIGITDIFLEDYDYGQGKITISDSVRGAFTYYWGSMGGKICDFIPGTSPCYFADKLLGTTDSQIFDSKGSVKNIRRYIREELSYELPWYTFMDAQKEMRFELKELENCYSDRDFVDACNNFVDNLYTDLPYKEDEEFKSIIRGVFETEPWNFITTKYSPKYKWICEIHGKLKKILK